MMHGPTYITLASSCGIWWIVVSADKGPPYQILHSRSMCHACSGRKVGSWGDDDDDDDAILVL